MHAVTITQITPTELETIIENSIKKFFSVQPLAPKVDANPWFDLSQLCSYLPDKPAKATVYGYVSANTIPYHKGAKKLRFLKSEIDAWLKEGKIKSVSEHAADADTLLSNSKTKRA